MLLRRITEHVKAQNWTAVGLGFGIIQDEALRDRLTEYVLMQREDQ